MKMMECRVEPHFAKTWPVHNSNQIPGSIGVCIILLLLVQFQDNFVHTREGGELKNETCYAVLRNLLLLIGRILYDKELLKMYSYRSGNYRTDRSM